MIGISNRFVVAANIPVASSAVLITTGLSFPIAATQRVHARFHFIFSVGATGGIRSQIVVPAAVTNFINTILLWNTVAPSVTSGSQTSSAAFTNALANAGTHFIDMELDLENGANAGTVDLQFAQNTSDVLTLTLFRGSFAEITYL